MNHDDLPDEWERAIQHAAEKMAKEIREEIDKEVIKEIFDLIKRQDDEAWERGKKAMGG